MFFNPVMLKILGEQQGKCEKYKLIVGGDTCCVEHKNRSDEEIN